MSFVVCMLGLIAWNASWEKPAPPWKFIRVGRVGRFEWIDQANRLSVHSITSAEQRQRREFAASQIVLESEDRLLARLHDVMARRPWDSPAYRAALTQFTAVERVRDAHRFHAPAEPIVKPEVNINLPACTVMAAALPSLWLLVAYRRNRSRIRARVARSIRWEPAHRLTRLERTRRRVFVWAAVASLLLSIAFALIWVRSYLVSDLLEQVRFGSDARGWRPSIIEIATHQGGVRFGREDFFSRTRRPLTVNPVDFREWEHDPDHPQTPRWHKLPPSPTPPEAVWSYGFQSQRLNNPGGTGFYGAIPFWFPAVLCLIPPALWLLVHRKRPVRDGVCADCGYDLTGNTSGICPECGSVVSLSAETIPLNTSRVD